ncbi:MAG: hypothetical protein FWD68_17965 [Alphaproteobacteria bacterium]|nr:hypothetical protein [Alphaproteobacteria bacterium]
MERVLDSTELDHWGVCEVSASKELIVMNLRTTGLLGRGVSTNAARAKTQHSSRELSQTLYDEFDVDGVLYASRLTSAKCVAVYDRAVTGKLVSTAVNSLSLHPQLTDALNSINVSIEFDP